MEIFSAGQAREYHDLAVAKANRIAEETLAPAVLHRIAEDIYNTCQKRKTELRFYLKSGCDTHTNYGEDVWHRVEAIVSSELRQLGYTVNYVGGAFDRLCINW